MRGTKAAPWRAIGGSSMPIGATRHHASRHCASMRPEPAHAAIDSAFVGRALVSSRDCATGTGHSIVGSRCRQRLPRQRRQRVRPAQGRRRPLGMGQLHGVRTVDVRAGAGHGGRRPLRNSRPPAGTGIQGLEDPHEHAQRFAGGDTMTPSRLGLSAVVGAILAPSVAGGGRAAAGARGRRDRDAAAARAPHTRS